MLPYLDMDAGLAGTHNMTECSVLQDSEFSVLKGCSEIK